MKTCCACHAKKLLSEYTVNRRRRDGLESYCRDCKKIRNNTFVPKAPEKYRATRRAHYQRNVDRLRADAAKKRQGEKYRAEQAARAARWAKENPHRIAAAITARRARKRDATVGVVDYERIFLRDNGYCHICGEWIEPGDLHFDHVVPLHRGGTHTTSNLRMAHAWCNRSKGAKLMSELLEAA